MRLLVQRDHTKDVEVLVENHDLLRSLNELDRKQCDAVSARAGAREASAGGVVDRTHVHKFLSFLPRPGLKGNRIASSLRGYGGLGCRGWHAGLIAGYLKFPISTARAATLIYTREVRSPLWCSWRRTDGSLVLSRNRRHRHH